MGGSGRGIPPPRPVFGPTHVRPMPPQRPNSRLPLVAEGEDPKLGLEISLCEPALPAVNTGAMTPPLELLEAPSPSRSPPPRPTIAVPTTALQDDRKRSVRMYARSTLTILTSSGVKGRLGNSITNV